MNEKEITLGQRFGSLFDYVYNRRTYLVEAGLSHRTEFRMRRILNLFQPYLFRKWTDEGAAEFIHNHYVELRQLIPPRETNVISRLENLYMASKTYFVIHSKKAEPCTQLSAF